MTKQAGSPYLNRIHDDEIPSVVTTLLYQWVTNPHDQIGDLINKHHPGIPLSQKNMLAKLVISNIRLMDKAFETVGHNAGPADN